MRRQAAKLFDSMQLVEAYQLYEDAKEKLRDLNEATKRNEATILAEQAKIAAATDVLGAADLRKQAAEVLLSVDREVAFDEFHAAASEVYKRGEISVKPDALVRAQQLALRAMDAAGTPTIPWPAPRPEMKEEWAMAANMLGIALGTLGQRAGDDAPLKDAVTAFKDALTVHTKTDLPRQWAMTQNNLGNALSTLGQRAGDDAALKDAVAAFKDALTVRTKKDLPRQWAGTTANLGLAQWSLSDLTGETALKQEAEENFRAALDIFRQGPVPYEITRLENWMRHIGLDPDTE
ncbi:MAG: tetratricopeptide repeat protein [bacterium]